MWPYEIEGVLLACFFSDMPGTLGPPASKEKVIGFSFHYQRTVSPRHSAKDVSSRRRHA